MTIDRSAFYRETPTDTDPDMSYLGEYSNNMQRHHVDRQDRGEMGRNEFRFFNWSGMSDVENLEADYARAEAYNRGDWHMIGIRAAIDLEIPCKAGGTISQTIASPGLWGIESDSGPEYLDEAYAEECNQLADMLTAMGITVEGVPDAV